MLRQSGQRTNQGSRIFLETSSNAIDVSAALNEKIEIEHVRRDHDIYLDGEQVDKLLVLEEGWAYRYRLLNDGRRHIINFLISGNLIGPYTLTANHFLATLTDATIGRLPKKWLRLPIHESPELIAAVNTALSQEFEILSEHALSLARLNALERMARLLLELGERTHQASLSDGLSFTFPASQEIIADCLGLSVVHVNRTLRRLREDEIASVHNGQVDIIDPQRLSHLAIGEAKTDFA